MAENRPQVVYSDVAEGADLQGQLFADKKFFIAQRCPMRSSFIQQVKSNGGKIVPLEKMADYLIVDHMRKDVPAGSISYTFIEQSIRNGDLEDPDDHRAGEPAGTVREIGSLRPTKGVRVPYTAEDDRQLYNWIKSYERQGGAIMGNEIYKQLELKNPRHPWQSWRDRYVKQLQYKPPPGCEPANGPLSPPSDEPPSDVDISTGQPAEQSKAKKQSRIAETRPARAETSTRLYKVDDSRRARSCSWTSEDWNELYYNVPKIQETPAREYLAGWKGFAGNTNHTAEQWRNYYEKTVLPQWEKDQKTKETPQKSSENNTDTQQRENSESPAPAPSTTRSRKDQRKPPSVVITTPKRTDNFEKRSLTPKNEPEVTVVQEPPAVAEPKTTFEELVHEMMTSRQGQPPGEAYRFYFTAHRHEVDCSPTDYTGPHRILKPRWRALTERDQAPYCEMEAADKERYRLEDSPTERREWLFANGYSSDSDAKKRSREDSIESGNKQENLPDPRESKKQRQQEQIIVLEDENTGSHALSQDTTDHDEDALEENKPGEHGETESYLEHAQKTYFELPDDSESEEDEEEIPEAPASVIRTHRVIDLSDAGEMESEADEEEEEDEDEDEDELTPTSGHVAIYQAFESPSPRQSRYRPPTTLDTQAILADPTQALDLDLPEIAADSTQSDSAYNHSSSPAPGHAASDGTSHSIREFRSLQELERQRQCSPPMDLDMPLPDIDSDDELDSEMSNDLDPPLDGEGTVAFYNKMLQRGYDGELVKDVLRACITRAQLSEEVLEDVAQGQPWPHRRGVWTAEDDRDLESTDGRRVRRVAEKHTDDGWGGCAERRTALDYIRRVSAQQHG